MSERVSHGALTVMEFHSTSYFISSFFSKVSRWSFFGFLIPTVLVFSPSLSGDFIWDDFTYILNNPVLNSSGALHKIWLSGENADYWPVSYSVLYFLKEIFGDQSSGYHGVQIVLHAAVCTTLFRIFSLLGLRFALFWALLFCLHPLNAQTVSWIFQIKTTLSVLLSLISARFFIYSFHDSEKLWLPLSLFTFALSLLAKGTAIMLPFTFFIFALWQGPGVPRARLQQTAIKIGPFFLLSLAAGVIHLFWTQDSFPLPPSERIIPDLWAERLMGAGQIIGFYIWKSFAPLSVSFLYPRWNFADVGWLPTLVVLLFLPSVFFIRNRAAALAALGLGFFMLNLFPVLGFVEVYFLRYSWVADHYAYLPLAGLIGGLGGALENFSAKIGQRPNWGLKTAGAAVLLVLSFLSFSHAKIFINEEAVWNDSLKKNPRAWMAHMGLGLLEKKQGRLQEALEHYSASLNIYPTAQGHYNRGLIFEATGDLRQAELEYRQAAELHPYFAPIRNNLGALLARQGHRDAALIELNEALRLDPENYEAHFNLSLVYREQSDAANAEKHLNEAQRIRAKREGDRQK